MTVYVKAQIKIPRTAKKLYLTSKTALNIPSPDGTDGEFTKYALLHSLFEEDKVYDLGRVKFIVAGINTVATTHIYGEWGIFDCSNYLKSSDFWHEHTEEYKRIFGTAVWCATHYRAICDMVYDKIVADPEINRLDSVELDRWLPMDEEKAILWDKLKLLENHLHPTYWKRLLKWYETWQWDYK